MISVTTKVTLATEEVITVTLKAILAITKMIMATKTDLDHWGSDDSHVKSYLIHCKLTKVILATNKLISTTKKVIVALT